MFIGWVYLVIVIMVFCFWLLILLRLMVRFIVRLRSLLMIMILLLWIVCCWLLRKFLVLFCWLCWLLWFWCCCCWLIIGWVLGWLNWFSRCRWWMKIFVWFFCWIRLKRSVCWFVSLSVCLRNLVFCCWRCRFWFGKCISRWWCLVRLCCRWMIVVVSWLLLKFVYVLMKLLLCCFDFMCIKELYEIFLIC